MRITFDCRFGYANRSLSGFWHVDYYAGWFPGSSHSTQRVGDLLTCLPGSEKLLSVLFPFFQGDVTRKDQGRVIRSVVGMVESYDVRSLNCRQRLRRSSGGVAIYPFSVINSHKNIVCY